MQSAGYHIIPVNPNETDVLGEPSYASLEEIPQKIEIVDIFRCPDQVRPSWTPHPRQRQSNLDATRHRQPSRRRKSPSRRNHSGNGRLHPNRTQKT